MPEARGAILVGGGDVLLAPVGDVTFTLGVRVPLLEAFDGVHAEGVALQAGLTCDFR
ncbi:MAG: hypothetical protein U1F43_29310 [Myxococcota bacterium]